MSDRDVLGLRVHLTRLTEQLAVPRTARDPREVVTLLQSVRDEADAALAAFGGR